MPADMTVRCHDLVEKNVRRPVKSLLTWMQELGQTECLSINRWVCRVVLLTVLPSSFDKSRSNRLAVPHPILLVALRGCVGYV